MIVELQEALLADGGAVFAGPIAVGGELPGGAESGYPSDRCGDSPSEPGSSRTAPGEPAAGVGATQGRDGIGAVRDDLGCFGVDAQCAPRCLHSSPSGREIRLLLEA